MVIIPEGERKMKLSDKEKILIERYRAGASVDIYQWVDTYEEMEQATEGFRIVRLYEAEDEERVIFGSSTSDNPELVVFLSTGKEVK